ncbi:thioesterase family protein [Nocardioides sediminis]|jgi:fluoroacetyl-CoA thioesterase|uniref:thioesterase family protein n=1 Tax=Nocardioides sediminis TaxID=433648 RepID=UPI000D2FFC43|nr:hotdog domain-containing protein [Nocardioides sediminis]
MEDLAPGAEGVLARTVEQQHTTRRGDYDIFSTPNLVLLLEEAAIEALAPYLGEDQASVGTKVEVAHTAATLLGQTVTATATVTEVDRRRVVFSIDVRDDVEQIGSGTHERFVIDVPGFEERLAQKSHQLG